MASRQPASGNKASASILIVDDESFVRETLELYLSAEGFDVHAAAGGRQALKICSDEPIDLAILDILMPEMDGITLLGEMKKAHPDVEVIMASGCGTLETAVEAMRRGAQDYISKPILNFDDELLRVVKKALERRRLRLANRTLAGDLQTAHRELEEAHRVLERRLERTAALLEDGHRLGFQRSPECILEAASGALRNTLGVPQALVLIDDGATWSCHAAPGLPAPQGEFPIPCAPLPGDPLPAGSGERHPISALPAIAKLIGSLGEDPQEGTDLGVLPLRAGGDE
ncbi:MAG: sigma-54-dependent transcriptional regulator, partial [Planctomycetota bacterium]